MKGVNFILQAKELNIGTLKEFGHISFCNETFVIYLFFITSHHTLLKINKEGYVVLEQLINDIGHDGKSWVVSISFCSYWGIC